ncbi:hypothetical protein BH20ACT1_BH20ACT1_08450 [soil metagenome]
MVGATLGLSARQEPVYEAEALFLNARGSQESTDTEVQVLQGPLVRALVEQELDEAGTIEAEAVSGARPSG